MRYVLYMRQKSYWLMLFSPNLLIGQQSSDSAPTNEFGFTHSTYVSLGFSQTELPNPLYKDKVNNYLMNPVKLCQYGYGVGWFGWFPLNHLLSIKPQIETIFSNLAMGCNQKIYAKVYDLCFSNTFQIAIKKANPNGIIYCARNMSCYLTSKQPYVSLGPKISLRKYDKGFINKGFKNVVAYGFMIGYGINYEFHGTNFAPEIKYHIETTDLAFVTKQIYHSVSVAINLF